MLAETLADGEDVCPGEGAKVVLGTFTRFLTETLAEPSDDSIFTSPGWSDSYDFTSPFASILIFVRVFVWEEFWLTLVLTVLFTVTLEREFAPFPDISTVVLAAA